MEEKIYVRYSDFVLGIRAISKINSIRDIVEKGEGFCSGSILAVLGLPAKNPKTPLSFEDIQEDEDAKSN